MANQAGHFSLRERQRQRMQQRASGNAERDLRQGEGGIRMRLVFLHSVQLVEREQHAVPGWRNDKVNENDYYSCEIIGETVQVFQALWALAGSEGLINNRIFYHVFLGFTDA